MTISRKGVLYFPKKGTFYCIIFLNWHQEFLLSLPSIILSFVKTLHADRQLNLHNYGLGMRFWASPARTDCDVCVSHVSFRFSSALECRSTITVVFLTVPSEAGLVLHYSPIVFHGQVSSGSAGYLPFVKLTDRTFAFSTARSYAVSTPPWDKFSFSSPCLRACGLFHHQFFETEEG